MPMIREPHVSVRNGLTRPRLARPAASPVRPALGSSGGLSSLRFALFALLTLVLFLRPADLLTGLEGWPVYEVTILACMVLMLPQLLANLQWRSLRTQPIVLCVGGLLISVGLSIALAPGADLATAFDGVFAFFKVAVSFLLLIAAVNTTSRLQSYLRWLAMCILALAGLGLLQFYGLIDLAALAPVTDRHVDKESGTVETLMRLCGVGIFGNPNDLARMLAVGLVIALYFLIEGRSAITRALWVLAICVLGYSLFLTHSRGGFLAFLGSIVVLLLQRFGRTKALVIAAVTVPVLLLLSSGRQTQITTKEGTGQQRIQAWSDGFEAARSSPLLGIGMGNYEEIAGGLGAHNSFVHAYVELGLVGGTLFVGAFYCALWLPRQFGRHSAALGDLTLERLRPCIVAIIAGYVIGMLSSSRTYVIPTYLLLGLAAVWLRLAMQRVSLPAAVFSPRLVLRVAVVSIATIIALQAFIILMVRWEGS